MADGLSLDALQVIRIRQMNGIRRFGLSIPQYREIQARSRAQTAEAYLRLRGIDPADPAAATFRAQYLADTAGNVTDLEDAGAGQFWGGLLDRVIATGTRTGQWTCARPIIATERGGDINGYCFVDAAGTAAILVDSYLATFAHLLAKVVAMALTAPDATQIALDRQAFADRLHQPETISRLADMLMAFVEAGTCSAAEQYWADPRYEWLVNQLRDGMEEFIVGHECGHIQLRHVHDPHMCTGHGLEALTQMINENTPNYIYRHHREREADSFGLSMVLNGVDFDSGDSELRFAGPFLFFIGLDLLERMLFFYTTGRSFWDRPEDALGLILSTLRPTTHPPAYSRARFLVDQIERSNAPARFKAVATFFGSDVPAAFAEAQRTIERVIKDRVGPERVHARWQAKQGEFAVMAAAGREALQRVGAGGQDADQAEGGSGALPGGGGAASQ
jgi:hypothetical protein